MHSYYVFLSRFSIRFFIFFCCFISFAQSTRSSVCSFFCVFHFTTVFLSLGHLLHSSYFTSHTKREKDKKRKRMRICRNLSNVQKFPKLDSNGRGWGWAMIEMEKKILFSFFGMVFYCAHKHFLPRLCFFRWRFLSVFFMCACVYVWVNLCETASFMAHCIMLAAKRGDGVLKKIFPHFYWISDGESDANSTQ